MPEISRPDSVQREVSRVVSTVLWATGLGLFLTAILWDTLVGNAHWGIGRKQSLGMLAGIALLICGTVLSPRTLPFRRRFLARRVLGLSPLRWATAVVLITLGAFPPLIFSEAELLSASTWILLCYISAACIVFPLHLGVAVLVMTVILQAGLAAISAAKIDLTGLPLTILDLRLAVSNPIGVWSALDLASWTRHAAVAGLILAGTLMCLSATKDFISLRETKGFRQLGRLAAGRLAILLAIAMLAAWHLDRVFSEIGNSNETWDIAGVAELSTQAGILTFLAYSYRAEMENAADYFSAYKTGPPPGNTEVRAAARNFVSHPAAGESERGVHPNVLVVLAESTFDPSHAFDLRGDFHSDLFSEREHTSAVGPLHVNAVGGGSWITEFEILVGIDARVFGYSGYYTHASVSPFVTQSFATYLRDKGYETWVFIPHDGAFYNYRTAYQHYGFQNILDSIDLRQTTDWYDSDIKVIEDFIGLMGEQPGAPFFAHVLLNENHGPHDCEASVVDSFSVRFARSEEFEANCQLAEYLRRLESTTAAVSLARDYLRDLEHRTGRPFVLLVYGDHQPYSFTGEWGGKIDFDPLRIESRKNITFFHLLTSIRNRLTCCDEMIPATLLPTLVSAFTSDDVDGLFLPVNLWLYEQCGVDAVGREPLTWLTRSQSAILAHESATAGISTRSPQCETAYRRALATYRRSGLIMAERDPW